MMTFLLSLSFLQNSFLAGLLSGIICGITGTFVVIKRISYIAGGITHSILGGIGLAYFLGISPLVGAFVSAILSAIIIGFVSLRHKEYSDTIIGAIWALGMAIGIIFMHLTPGYNKDLMSLLFGNILLVSNSQLLVLSLFGFVVIFITFLFYKQFIAISFDEEFCRVRNIKVESFYFLLLILIAISIVVLTQVVGIILLITMLTIPTNISFKFSLSPIKIMVFSILLSVLFTFGGILISYMINLPSGAVIIVLSSLFYFISLFLKRNKSIKK